jgi:hypothetical protein
MPGDDLPGAGHDDQKPPVIAATAGRELEA